ncbi:cation transporting ATPase C-terminal domain-containing protein, partial [archaeon]|nr:cation transporting ATPase C-terminal domain-containing protein [archaeon]
LIYSVIIALALQFILLYTRLANLFGVVRLALIDWLKIMGFSVAGIFILEVRKIFLKQ